MKKVCIYKLDTKHLSKNEWEGIISYFNRKDNTKHKIIFEVLLKTALYKYYKNENLISEQSKKMTGKILFFNIFWFV